MLKNVKVWIIMIKLLTLLKNKYLIKKDSHKKYFAKVNKRFEMWVQKKKYLKMNLKFGLNLYCPFYSTSINIKYN
jgi:hypothetical protein